jgi:hypothetical protein
MRRWIDKNQVTVLSWILIWPIVGLVIWLAVSGR